MPQQATVQQATRRQAPPQQTRRPRPLRAVLLALTTSVAVVAGATPSVAGAVQVGAPAAAEAPNSSPAGQDRVRLGGGRAVKGEYLVALEAGQQVRPTAQRLRRDHGGRVAQTYEAVLGGFLLLATPAQAQRYAADDRVRSVVPNEVVRATAEVESTGARRIGATQARSSGRTGAGITVAVLDTGIDLDHPDLVANLSPTLGVNCVDPGTAPEDLHGHGTHVAGIIAAAWNGAQVVGVAPGATLVPVQVLPARGNGSLSALVCGLDYVTRHADQIDVVNVSLGGVGEAGHCADGGLHQAVCQTVAAGVTVVVSAGNDKKQAATYVPARYPEVITVSALDDRDGTSAKDRMASFSNGGDAIDVTAPGVSIVSTGRGGGLVTMSGTSMASPHVAGVVALALAKDPRLTPVEVRALLKTSGDCPDGTVAGSDGSCSGQGVWPEDRDRIPEPLVDAARVAGPAARTVIVDNRERPRTVRRVTQRR